MDPASADDLVSGAASHARVEFEGVQGGALALGDAQRSVRRAPRLEEAQEAEGSRRWS